MAFGKPEKGECSGSDCGSNTWLANKSKKLCARCNHRLKVEAKANRRHMWDEYDDQEQMFDAIYELNKHHWVSEVSGTALPPKPKETASDYAKGQFFKSFAHIVRKGKYRELKLVTDNIALLTGEEHRRYDDNIATIEDSVTGQVLDQDWAAILTRRDQLYDRVRATGLGR